VKPARPELGITLKQVIGATANSKNAFDTNGDCLAFTAGAAAVIATYDGEKKHVEQRFYRARPTATPLNPTPIVYGDSTPTHASDSRTRTAATLRSAGVGISPFGTPNTDWSDNSTGKSWSAKERVKAATCVSFSPSGKFLAVGETGYKPRVLVFSTASDASTDIPLTSLTDHTFGVRCVAFSPDSQYLASLGAANDGFLYIWRINDRNGAATLFASNKCTSNITQIAWIGNKLVTIGTRHVKVWRVEESNPTTPARQSDVLQALTTPDHKALLGRNCVLGDLLEATFTTFVPLGISQAIVCSDKGTVCLLSDEDGHQRFVKLADMSFPITAAILIEGDQLLLSGGQGEIKLLKFDSMKPSPRITKQLRNLIGTLDVNGVIRLVEVTNTDNNRTTWEAAYKLPAHGGPVLGVRALEYGNATDASFFTWAGDGTVLFWDSEGHCTKKLQIEVDQLPLDDGLPNELKVAKLVASKGLLVTGDKYGIMRIHDITSGKDISSVRAHGGEITDVAVHDSESRYIATSGRDRTVQVFTERGDSWELLHTLDEHVGAVNGVLFSKDGERLLSCSSDRTIVVRECVSREHAGESMSAFLIARTITLKATPMAMVFDPLQDNTLILSTIDRFMHRYDVRNGRTISAFKTGDTEGGDAVVMSSLVPIPTLMNGSMVAALSSTDKSIRLYDESGTLLSRDWGHTEGVTDIALIDSGEAYSAAGTSQNTLVTVALDGTIFSWRVDLRPHKRQEMSRSLDLLNSSGTPNGTPTAERDSLMSRPPLRRVLSQSELARFQKGADLDDTPTKAPGQRSPPRIRKRTSRVSLMQTPKLEASPAAARVSNINSPRRKSILSTSTENLSPEMVRELEKELSLTLRVLGEKVRERGVDEEMLGRVLDQYSNRLFEMLDERLA
ncbi:WD40 repeat-like protein, partial [Rhizodiscina lignyota]